MIKYITNQPIKIIMELSHNCNLNCIMCGFGGKDINPKKFMNDDILNKVINEKNYLGNIKEIRLNGRGESTISPNFISQIMKIKSEFPNAQLSMFTNLMYQNNKISDIINNYKINLFISMDSSNKEKYEYIRKNSKYELFIDRLTNEIDGYIVFTLQKYNINDLNDIGRFVQKYDMGLIINVIKVDNLKYILDFNKILSENWNNIIINLNKLHDYVPYDKLFIPDQIWGKKIPSFISTTVTCGSLPICPNIKEEIMVSYDGVIYPCNMFNPYIYGNIKNTKIESLWNGEKRKNFLENHKSNYYCKNCEYMIHK